MSCLVAKAPNTQQERRDPWIGQYPSRVVCQAMPLQIADKDEDVDQTRTVRPVGGQQSTSGHRQVCHR